jgi:NhaP-type Na+/H+ or K+/H+ antiporter
VLGLVALGAAWLPAYLDTRPISLPIVLIGAGALLFALPSPLQPPDPREHLEVTEHLTELGVLVALIGSGLSIDRPIGLRRWANTWRLLAIALPLGVVATALTGWWLLGLAPASAVLLGAALAPTDPVLASDVQVGEPSVAQEPDDEIDEVEPEDEVRVTLTSEAGLNDGLAFPFVYAAIAMVATDGAGWIGRWAVVDVALRTATGVAVGVAIGWVLCRIAFRPPGPATALSEASDGFVGIAAMLLAYGVGQLAHGYGFVAVFIAAVTLRNGERHHPYHQVLHAFTTQIERLVIVVLLVLFGGSLVGGVLHGLTWQAVAVSAGIVLVIRPITARLSLIGASVRPAERTAISFFGIRGIGSLYYLAYALQQQPFSDTDALWATVACTIVLSAVIHGATATPALRVLDERRERRRRRGLEREATEPGSAPG